MLKVNASADTANVAEVVTKVGLPDGLSCALWRQEDHPLSLVKDEPLDQHQNLNERLAESNPVAKKRTTKLAGDPNSAQ